MIPTFMCSYVSFARRRGPMLFFTTARCLTRDVFGIAICLHFDCSALACALELYSSLCNKRRGKLPCFSVIHTCHSFIIQMHLCDGAV